MKNKDYINSRPSNVNNIGEDLSGAQRHHFKTYDEKQAIKVKNKESKDIKTTLDKLKAKAIESQDTQDLYNYHFQYLVLKYDFKSSNADELKEEIKLKRSFATDNRTSENISTFNKALNALNKFRKIEWAINSNYTYSIEELFKKLEPKAALRYVENNGKTYNWSTLEQKSSAFNIHYLKTNLRALQFGNSVTDKERIYLTNSLTNELQIFKCTFNHLDLSKIGFSFGARGKAGSVAYFQPSSNIISVNRHNIGSLIHEIGHYLDYTLGEYKLSNSITIEMKKEYFQKLKTSQVDPNFRKYLMKPTEIFARLFEQYCLSLKCFTEFGLTVDQSIMPELNKVNFEFISKMIGGESWT